MSIRLTTTEDAILAKLCRLDGCTPSDLVREMMHELARRRGLLEPELAPVSAVEVTP